MYGQLHFEAFGLCLSQYLLCSAEFATVLLWMLGPWGHPHPAVITLSVHALFHHVPVLCLLFYSMGFLFLRMVFLGVSSPQT